jgi:hypothetical protein
MLENSLANLGTELERPALNWQPMAVYENVYFNESHNAFPEPFASEAETEGFLSGSEHWTLCSKGETMYSRDFVQCGAALIRNKSTGLVTLIHESMWSESADVGLALQRADDVEVITILGPYSYMHFDNVRYAHEKDPRDAADTIVGIDRQRSHRYRGGTGIEENMAHIFLNGSALLGLSEREIAEGLSNLQLTQQVGETQHIGRIEIPVSRNETNRWYLLYRPKENIIWIYESGTKKLFKYPGFEN